MGGCTVYDLLESLNLYDDIGTYTTRYPCWDDGTFVSVPLKPIFDLQFNMEYLDSAVRGELVEP
ncbi:hypothetical protein Mettu_3183 [Methylobacter tundripaludum SV96]|uniref:Uncharacterized protein n=1 Tax=Methylobacter tundripaludum (strain ATCC BAA-1195 / DSM 17260 / SV96) TaxID=697282 RepID=G3IYK9_METTV|nr:hypothetical protein Mettu_3183 [Methylobacter tundripaludum SV96]